MLVCSVLIISRLDSRSKFQMLTQFSGRHIGVPLRYTNMAFPYWALYISAKHFDEYLKFARTHRPKLGEVTCFVVLYNTKIS